MKKTQKNEISLLFIEDKNDSELVKKLEKVIRKEIKKGGAFTKDLPIEKLNLEKKGH